MSMKRNDWATLLSILTLSVLAGMWHVAGYAATRFWVILFPPALGLPAFIPPLRLAPLGHTSLWVWIIDLASVALMLLTAVIWLKTTTDQAATRLRIFWRSTWITVIAITIGNIARMVAQSFILQSDLATFAGQILGNIVISALTGFLLGVAVGAVAAAVARVQNQSQNSLFN